MQEPSEFHVPLCVITERYDTSFPDLAFFGESSLFQIPCFTKPPTTSVLLHNPSGCGGANNRQHKHRDAFVLSLLLHILNGCEVAAADSKNLLQTEATERRV